MGIEKGIHGTAADNYTDFEKIRLVLNLQGAVLKTMAELVEFRDGDTGGHIERTQRYLGVLLGAMIEKCVYKEKVDEWDLWLVINSVQLHDVGKISVRDSILQKPGKLTDCEFEEMKGHAMYGETVIDKIGNYIKDPVFLKYAKILTGNHHEKWDGSGYPRGLKGHDIPLLGRLMAIADVYDALISERPYKKAFTHERSVEIMKAGRGTHFDPALLDLFLEVTEEFEVISVNYKGGLS